MYIYTWVIIIVSYNTHRKSLDVSVTFQNCFCLNLDTVVLFERESLLVLCECSLGKKTYGTNGAFMYKHNKKKTEKKN